MDIHVSLPFPRVGDNIPYNKILQDYVGFIELNVNLGREHRQKKRDNAIDTMETLRWKGR